MGPQHHLRLLNHPPSIQRARVDHVQTLATTTASAFRHPVPNGPPTFEAALDSFRRKMAQEWRTHVHSFYAAQNSLKSHDSSQSTSNKVSKEHAESQQNQVSYFKSYRHTQSPFGANDTFERAMDEPDIPEHFEQLDEVDLIDVTRI